mgnify:CR=1 FL=1
MKEILKGIVNYFVDRTKPLTPKITWSVCILLVLILSDNIIGFSFYYMNNQKLEHIKKIEEIKQLCKLDTLLYRHINKLEQDVLNRKNIFQQFGELFDKAELSKKTELNTEQTLELNKGNESKSSILKIFPEQPNRSQIWHTITSSFILIVILILLIITLLITPFIKTEDKTALLIGCLFGSLLIAGIIWLTQWAFGLIPVIFHRAYINYSIQIVFQIFIIWGIWKISKK